MRDRWTDSLHLGPTRETHGNMACPRCNKKIFRHDLMDAGCRFCWTMEEFQASEHEPEPDSYEKSDVHQEILDFCKRHNTGGIIKNNSLFINGRKIADLNGGFSSELKLAILNS